MDGGDVCFARFCYTDSFFSSSLSRGRYCVCDVCHLAMACNTVAASMLYNIIAILLQLSIEYTVYPYTVYSSIAHGYINTRVRTCSS